MNQGDPQIAHRSQGPPVAFAVSCCLRCAKCFSGYPERSCVWKHGNKDCKECARKHKPCLPIPQKFAVEFNKLWVLYQTYCNATGDAAKAAAHIPLEAAQRHFTAGVELFMRQQAPPKTELAARLIQLRSLDRLNATMEGILDVLRYANRLQPIIHDPDEEDEDNGV